MLFCLRGVHSCDRICQYAWRGRSLVSQLCSPVGISRWESSGSLLEISSPSLLACAVPARVPAFVHRKRCAGRLCGSRNVDVPIEYAYRRNRAEIRESWTPKLVACVEGGPLSGRPEGCKSVILSSPLASASTSSSSGPRSSNSSSGITARRDKAANSRSWIWSGSSAKPWICYWAYRTPVTA